MESGPKWIQDESDLQQQSLKEQLDNLETGWNDVHILWENRKKMLIQALNHQVKKTTSKNLEDRHVDERISIFLVRSLVTENRNNPTVFI